MEEKTEMIEERKGNLLEQEDIKFIVHCANLWHTMGAGIAAAIAKKYPEALEADKETPHGDECKLGGFSVAKTWDDKRVVNLYGQVGIGNDGHPIRRNLRYDSFYDALYRFKSRLEKCPSQKSWPIGIPAMIGCGLAGGDWEIVRSIIYALFEETKFNVVIVDFNS